MPSVKRGNGTWDKAPGTAPGHFERSDGRVMTQDEIAAVGHTVTPAELSRVSMAARFAHERAEAAAQRDKAPAQQAPTPATPNATVRERAGGRPFTERGQPTPLEAAAIALIPVHKTLVGIAKALGVSRKAIEQRLLLARDRGVVFDWPEPARKGPQRDELLIRPPKPKPVPAPTRLTDPAENDALVSSTNEATTEPIEPTDQSLDERVDQVVAASAPTAPWRARLEELYIDLLLRRAGDAPTDDPVFDRIERLLGMLAI